MGQSSRYLRFRSASVVYPGPPKTRQILSSKLDSLASCRGNSVRYSSEITDGTPAIRAPNSVLFNRAANCFLLFAGLIPIALVLWYVVTQGSRGPVGDQW